MRRPRQFRSPTKKATRYAWTSGAAAETSSAASRILRAKSRRDTAASWRFRLAEHHASAHAPKRPQMIGLQQPHIQLFAVIVHNDQFLGDGWPDDRWSKRVLREMEFGQGARIVGRIIGKIAINGVRLNRFRKIVEAVFEGGYAKCRCAAGS